MGNLVEMQHSHVTNFLEQLSYQGIHEHLVLRYRRDRDFAKRMSGMMLAEYQENPGKQYLVNVDQSLSRRELNDAARHAVRYTLRHDIVEALQPKTVNPHAGQLALPTCKPVDVIEMFTVPLFERVTEKEAIVLLAGMNLESVNTEEAFSFALQHSWGYDDMIITLAAQYRDPKSKHEGAMEFLDFSLNGHGDPMISLWAFRDFPPTCQFLAKRKKPAQEVTEE